MPDFVSALDTAIKNSLCFMMDGLGDALWTWGQGGGNGPGSYLVNPASFIYRKICNDEPPPAPPPPFLGGQCPCVEYRVTIAIVFSSRPDGVTCADGGSSTGPVLVYGPIGDISLVGSGLCGPTTAYLPCRGLTSGPCQPEQFLLQVANEDFLGLRKCEIVSIERTDGLPDDCGSLPPEYPPLPDNWNIHNTNVTYTNNDGLDLTIPLILAWGYADLDFNANIRIPFTLRLGDSTNNNQTILKGSLNISTGDVSYRPVTNYYGNPNPGNGPGDGNPDENLPEYPTIDLPLQPPISQEEESGKEPKLIAAIVTVVSLTSGSIGDIFQEQNPNIKVPNLGYINFFHRTGRISGAWSEDIPIKNTRQYVPVPFNGNVIDVRGTPRLGVTWVITPVFDTKQSDPQIPNESLVITGV